MNRFFCYLEIGRFIHLPVLLGRKNAKATAHTMRPFFACSFFDFFHLHHDYKLQCPERVANRLKLLEQNKHERFVKSQ